MLEDHTLALLPPLTSLPAAAAVAAAATEDGSPAVLPPVAPSWSRLEALAGVCLLPSLACALVAEWLGASRPSWLASMRDACLLLWLARLDQFGLA